jgi:hypothetical protein
MRIFVARETNARIMNILFAIVHQISKRCSLICKYIYIYIHNTQSICEPYTDVYNITGACIVLGTRIYSIYVCV